MFTAAQPDPTARFDHAVPPTLLPVAVRGRLPPATNGTLVHSGWTRVPFVAE